MSRSIVILFAVIYLLSSCRSTRNIQTAIVKKDTVTAPVVPVDRSKEDSAAFMRAYEIMCVPLKSGSGLRMKTVEAMSMRRAVVSTQIGADGLTVEIQHCISIAESKEDFAAAIIKLMRDTELRKQHIETGYNLAFQSYSAQKNTSGLLGFYRDLLS